MNNFEQKYKTLLSEILNNNCYTTSRTGTDVYKSFGKVLRHNMEEGFPLLTSKKMYLKNFIHELIWFLNGETNIKYLKDNGVNIWDNWADKNGNLGPVYGHQLRNFNSNGKDQLIELITNLKENPFSRRHVISLWNPLQIDEMSLPPCYQMFQFYVDTNHRLSINITMRSADTFVGLPYDFAMFAALLIVIAREVNLKPYEIQFNITDCHIYENQIHDVLKYINKPIHELSKLTYIGKLNNLKFNDFTLLNYVSEEFIKTPIAI